MKYVFNFRNSALISGNDICENSPNITKCSVENLQEIFHTTKDNAGNYNSNIRLIDGNSFEFMRPTMEFSLQQQHPVQTAGMKDLSRQVKLELQQDEEEKICAICSDKATGRHYKVYSCEGCKNFFRRSVRKDVKYVCPAYGKCAVHKDQRTRCKACRLKKCLKVGMRKEGWYIDFVLFECCLYSIFCLSLNSASYGIIITIIIIIFCSF